VNLDDIRAQVDPLLEQVRARTIGGERGAPSYRGSQGEAVEMQTRLLAALERVVPVGSAYAEQAARIVDHGGYAGYVAIQLAGVLSAVRADYESGYLQRVEALIHADVFGDFLEMADELLSKGYEDPAAVIVGSVLEEHLRKLAGKAGVEVEIDGRPRKADALNADLRKAEVYNNLEQKSVTAWLDLRNKAAHGQYGDYDKAQVEALLRDVRAFMLRHPA
jgi:hypothetical protein